MMAVVDPLAEASARVACATLIQRCAHAVCVGAPLYNHGKVRECIYLYAAAAERCMQHREGLPAEVIAHLQEAISAAGEQFSASHRAWVLRNGLDRAVASAVQICGSRSPPPEDAKNGTPVTPSKKVTGDCWAADCRHKAQFSTRESACRLLELPNDMSALLLGPLSAVSLSCLGGTCTALHKQARAHAATRLESVWPSPRGAGAEERCHVLWARTLHAIEEMVDHVGPNPSRRRWWDEWPQLMVAEAREALAPGTVDMGDFVRGGRRAIEALLTQHQLGLQWMVDAGWPPLHAAATMLLSSCCAAQLGRCIRQRRTTFAASCHALASALRERAAAISAPAPPVYAAIEGPMGLASADPVWRQLLRTPLRSGASFVVSAPVQACAYPTAVPDGTNHGPLERLISAACELRSGATIVCFVSEAQRCAGDALRTCIQTGPAAYVLPPLCTVTVIAEYLPGEWTHGGEAAPVPRRCVCVRVHAPY